MKSISSSRQSGAVSIFVVIFAALLITVVTVSFIRVMVNDQNQATNNELSQSAYDSAQAGVEDAKRSLLRYLSVCQNSTQAACDQLADDLSTDECNAGLRVGGVVPGSGSGEVPLQQDLAPGATVTEAYTCVKMALETPDYIGALAKNESKLVPLIAKNSDGSTDFDTVTVEWFSREDLSNGTSTATVNLRPVAGGANAQPLLAEASWPAERPPVLRTSLMQFGDSFTLQDFDASPSGESNTNTLFLYPTNNAVSGDLDFLGRDARRATSGDPIAQAPSSFAPQPVRCTATVGSGGYSCRASLTLPNPIGGGERTAYLRLTTLYNAANYRVSLSKNGNTTNFNGVQPEIDSTGRANDLFRRVASRVDLIDTSFPYPDSALDLNGNLCKTFAVTNTTYYAGAACTP